MYVLEIETLEVAVYTLFALITFAILYLLHNPSESFLSRIGSLLVFFHIFVLVLLLLHLLGAVTTPIPAEELWGRLDSFVVISFAIMYFGLQLTLIVNFDGKVAKKIRYLQTLHPISTIFTTCQFLTIRYLCPEYTDSKYFLFGHVIFGIHVTVYRYLVPTVIPTEEYFDILTDKSEIAAYMKENEGVAEDGTYESVNVKRKQIALFTWFYQTVRLVGHVSLGLTTIEENKQRQTYISIWPGTDNEQIGNDWRSGDVSTLESDVLEEHGYPDHILLFKRSSLLNEHDIILKMNDSNWPPDYNVFRQNCMSAIKTVLIAGGLKEHIFCGENFMIRLPATNTLEFAEEIPFAFILPNSPWFVQLLLFMLFSSMDICMRLLRTYGCCLAAYAAYYTLFGAEDEDFRFMDTIIEYLMQMWNSFIETYQPPYPSSYYVTYFAFCFFAAYFRPIEKLYKWMNDLICS